MSILHVYPAIYFLVNDGLCFLSTLLKLFWIYPDFWKGMGLILYFWSHTFFEAWWKSNPDFQKKQCSTGTTHQKSPGALCSFVEKMPLSFPSIFQWGNKQEYPRYLFYPNLYKDEWSFCMPKGKEFLHQNLYQFLFCLSIFLWVVALHSGGGWRPKNLFCICILYPHHPVACI